MQGTRVRSLVRELRSHMLFGTAKNIYRERERRKDGRQGNIITKKEKKHCTRCKQPSGGCHCPVAPQWVYACSAVSNSACVCLCAQSCPTLCDPVDCSPQGSSVHGILQARILEWVAISFSRRSSQAGDRNHISCIGRQILLPLSHWEDLRKSYS